MTTMTASNWRPTPAQVQFLRNVFAERVSAQEPNREQFWKNVTSVTSHGAFESVIEALKARPRADLKPAAPVPPVQLNLATEAGLYRNPDDGTLYRLSVSKPRNSWERPVTSVSVYSNKANIRRLTPEGRMVRPGKWTRLRSFERDSLLHYSYAEKTGRRPVGTKILASWFMSDEQKQEWAVGICLMCYKGLTDAVSVYNQIGPVCAKNWGFTLEMPPEDFRPSLDMTKGSV